MSMLITTSGRLGGVVLSEQASIKSIKDFGATGNGTTDDTLAIQTCIDYCIAHNVRVCFFPYGVYRTTSTLTVKSQSGPFCTLTLMGESSWWDANQGSEIHYDATSGCAINLQLNKGSVVSNLRVRGNFVSPGTGSDYIFYNQTFSDFNDGICDTSSTSPYAGVAVDYVDTSADTGTSGSTGIIIEHCEIKNFYVPIAISTNSVTRNGENVSIRYINFGDCNTCIAGGQDQEKCNTIEHISCWGDCFQIISLSANFGTSHAGNYFINDVNIAGRVVQFGHIETASWNSVAISNIFSETMVSLGYFRSDLMISFKNIFCDFLIPEIGGLQPVLRTIGRGISFDTCKFRYYGRPSQQLRLESDATFDKCIFRNLPISTDINLIPNFVNCILNTSDLSNSSYILQGENNLQSISISGTTVTYVKSVTQTSFSVGQLVAFVRADPIAWGIITSISGSTVTVSYVEKVADLNGSLTYSLNYYI